MTNDQIIDTIISENLSNIISSLSGGRKKGLAKLKRKYKDSTPKKEGETNEEYAKRIIDKYRKEHGEPHHKMKKRKITGGGSILYDFDEYKRKNKEVSTADAERIRSIIDVEKTNIAAIARILFPDHTDEGAQSQLRKILNGERKMTNKIAKKLLKMIDAGEIATK